MSTTKKAVKHKKTTKKETPKLALYGYAILVTDSNDKHFVRMRDGKVVEMNEINSFAIFENYAYYLSKSDAAPHLAETIEIAKRNPMVTPPCKAESIGLTFKIG